MPEPVRRTVLVREQYGLRSTAPSAARRPSSLLELIEDHGPSSETLGLLGRVYKDRWEAAREGSVLRAEGHLDQAIDAYRRGFEADWRDAYPGINAVTLMEIRDPGGARAAGAPAGREVREPPPHRRRRRGLLGSRDEARARRHRARPRRGLGGRACSAGGGAGALGAGEHGVQPVADPRVPRRATTRWSSGRTSSSGSSRARPTGSVREREELPALRSRQPAGHALARAGASAPARNRRRRMRTRARSRRHWLSRPTGRPAWTPRR